MSESPGYVYVLINRSMPGLVKIGRTARPPAQRASEISSVTGVPTPFELVFDIVVPDCVQAERILHRFLTQRGFRLSNNREFFEAPIRDVISLMLQTRELVERTAIRPTPDVDELLSDAEATITAAEEAAADPLLRIGAEHLIAAGEGSTSVLQRNLRIGYGQAAHMIDHYTTLGILGPQVGPSPRKVLISLEQLDAVLPRAETGP